MKEFEELGLPSDPAGLTALVADGYAAYTGLSKEKIELFVARATSIVVPMPRLPPLGKQRKLGNNNGLDAPKNAATTVNETVEPWNMTNAELSDDEVEFLFTVPPNTKVLPARSIIRTTKSNGLDPDAMGVVDNTDDELDTPNLQTLLMEFQGVMGRPAVDVYNAAFPNEEMDTVSVDSMNFRGKTYFKGHCYKYKYKPNCQVLVAIETLCSSKAFVSLVVPFEETALGTTSDGINFEPDFVPSKYCVVDGYKKVVGLESLCWEAEPMTMPLFLYHPQRTPSRREFAYSMRRCWRRKKQRPNIQSVDLFCGAGGMSVGLQNARISVAVAVDNDPNACKTYGKNHPSCKVFCCNVEDFKDVSKDMEGVFAHVHASPECQGFSKANWSGCEEKKRKSNERAYLFVEEVKRLKPDIGTFENVLGLWDRKNQPYLRHILLDLMKEKYQVRVYVLNASDYGDPQERERLFIVTSREDVPLPERPHETHGHNKTGKIPVVTAQDAIGDLISDTVVVNRKQPMADNQFKPPKLKANAPSVMIKCTGQLPLHYNHDDDDNLPESKGYITLPEAAALQSFPPTYEFFGDDESIRRQIGNAVPVLMAQAIGRSIYDILCWEYAPVNPDS